MNNIRYSEHVAAIHELGHALVACAIDFPFSRVEIFPNEKVGWAGKCHTDANPSNVSEPMVEAFNLAGPVAQSLFAPESLGVYRHLFWPSIFEGCLELDENDAPINGVFWWNDYGHSNYHVWAAAIRRKEANLHKPHLFDLEEELKLFFTSPPVNECLEILAQSLASRHVLEKAEIEGVFQMVPQQVIASLKVFVDTAPDPFAPLNVSKA